MYFWNDRELFTDLQSNKTTQKEMFRYYLVTFIFIETIMWLITFDNSPVTSQDHILYVTNIIFVTFGNMYAFKRYRPTGKYIERAVCLSVPIMIRVLAVTVPVLALLELLTIFQHMPVNLIAAVVVNIWFYLHLSNRMAAFTS